MKLGRFARQLYVVAVFFVASILTSGVAQAADGGLTAKVQASNPLKPAIVLTNTGKTACQVASSAFGTVSLTRVSQGGKVLTPKPMDVASDEAPDVVLVARLKTLKPGASLDIPLQVATVGSSHVLESVVWAPGAGLFGLQYEVASGRPLDMDATYDAPITAPSGAPMCAAASTMATAVTAKNSARWLGLAAAVMLALVIMLVLWWLLRARRPRPPHHRSGHAVAAVAVLVAGMAGLTLWHAPPAHADYNVPSDASGAFNDCMATFNAHRDITGPVLDALAGQHIEIVPNDTLTNDTVRYGDHYFRIYWDPASLGTYVGHDPGSPPVVSYPCPRLYHEMYHAYDMLNNTFSRDDCAGSGIETKEVMATRAENALRQALGMPPRTYYGRDPLPPGSCTPPPPPAPSCSGAACGQSNGDPHLVTFDGQRYDFQAVGEFTAARDPSGGFEVQTRQQPFPGSRVVSINTAVAMLVGTDRVEVGVRQGGVILLVDGKAQVLAQMTKLKGGGTILPLTPQMVRVQWPDGSFATLEVIGSWGLHLTLDVVGARQGKLEGLLGNFNGNKSDDLVIRGTKTTVQPVFSQIFPKFADSWRIDGKSSLFTYAKGTSTSTYTDRSFPDKQASAEGLPGRAAAEALCRNVGVSDPGALADCTLDVVLTGRPEFARAAMVGQFANTFGGKTFEVDITHPGDIGTAAFDGTAGQKVFIDIPHSTLPDQCGGIQLLAPDGSSISSGCVINGNGFIDASVLPATGTYHVAINPDDANIGNTRLTVITAIDQDGTITPDGAAVQATISRPGAVARFSFNGQAGEKVFLTIPVATLPDQCGGLTIVDTAGNSLQQGCVITGRGYVDTATLPAAGTYTVMVDPPDRHTGQAALRLTVVRDQRASLIVGGLGATATLARPGSVASFMFAGTAGERVYVDASRSTLPDQCGGFELHGPDGVSIDSGCIINGSGTLNQGGTVLPTTGTYTIVMDPAEAAIGHVTVRVHR